MVTGYPAELNEIVSEEGGLSRNTHQYPHSLSQTYGPYQPTRKCRTRCQWDHLQRRRICHLHCRPKKENKQKDKHDDKIEYKKEDSKGRYERCKKKDKNEYNEKETEDLIEKYGLNKV